METRTSLGHDVASLLVIAYPHFAPADHGRIARVREQHDPLHARVAPHLSLVYPVTELAVDAFVTDIERQAEGCGAISFVLRSALPVTDAMQDGAVVFLVPDEGFGALVRLHDRLYAGALAPFRRLDIPAIPHITVGRTTTPDACQALADELNATPFAIPGTITTLTVVSLKGAEVRTVSHLRLPP